MIAESRKFISGQKLAAPPLETVSATGVNPWEPTPLVTLSAFLSQVLSADHSCADAVSRVIAHRIEQRKKACSSDTGPYCKASQRLPANFVIRLVRKAGKVLREQSAKVSSWNGRAVKLIDGSTATMPDTSGNQEAYSQQKGQKPESGFPIARLVAIISLSCGALLGIAVGPYEGKETGEHALLRRIPDCLSFGEMIIAGRYYCSYRLIAILMQKGIDVVFQLHARHKSDFTQGEYPGKKGHLVTWKKPQRPAWMDEATYQFIPDELTVRETRVGKKILISTFFAPKEASRKEIEELYTSRWLIEVGLRFIKEVLHWRDQ